MRLKRQYHLAGNLCVRSKGCPPGQPRKKNTELERVWDNFSGFFAVWTRDLRRQKRYTYVRLALEHGLPKTTAYVRPDVRRAARLVRFP